MNLYTPIPKPLPSEEAAREKTARKLCSLPRWLYPYLDKARKEWERAETARLGAIERERERLEAIVRDPGYSDADKLSARIDLIGQQEMKPDFYD